MRLPPDHARELVAGAYDAADLEFRRIPPREAAEIILPDESPLDFKNQFAEEWDRLQKKDPDLTK